MWICFCVEIVNSVNVIYTSIYCASMNEVIISSEIFASQPKVFTPKPRDALGRYILYTGARWWAKRFSSVRPTLRWENHSGHHIECRAEEGILLYAVEYRCYVDNSGRVNWYIGQWDEVLVRDVLWLCFMEIGRASCRERVYLFV